MNDVVFIKSTNGLGTPLPGSDHVTGKLFYSDATLPSGFSSSARIKTIFGVPEAVALGITNTHLGETAAVAKVVAAGTPAAGNTIKITYTGINGLVTVLDTYTLTTADAVSTTTAAAAIVAAINAQTYLTGFSAAVSASTNILITTKGGEGIFPNSGTPYVTTLTGGGLTGAVTQPTGSGSTVLGVASDIDILYYHISEYFRLQPKGKLYVGIYATADVGTFSKITDMQNAANGEMKRIGIYQKSTAYSTAHLTAIQTVLSALETNKKPLCAWYQGDFSAVTDWTTAANLHLLTAPQVTTVIAQDGAAIGYKLFKATGKSIGSVGTAIGTKAFGKVNENIGWVGKFQIATTEYDTLAFANGDAYLSLSDGLISNLDAYGYVFLRKHVDKAGSFWNDSYTAVAVTNDFYNMENNETMYKAIKSCRTVLLDALNSPIKVNSNGTLSEDVIGYFQGLCNQALDLMLSNSEISAYQVIIDPSQNVLSTSKLALTIKIVPTGVARTIQVNIGFTLSITT